MGRGTTSLPALAVIGAVACGQGPPSAKRLRSPAPSPVAVVSDASPPGGPRFASVAPVFETHCGSCHDARRSDNAATQRVLESSKYPFATERPETLLEALARMFEVRRSIPEEERERALAWIRAGARGDDGQAPPYGQPR